MKANRVVTAFLACALLAGCSPSPVTPVPPPGACTTTTDEPSYGCAVIDATVLTAFAQPAVAYLALADTSDIARYGLVAPNGVFTDRAGHVLIEVQRRQAASQGTATVPLIAATLRTPRSGTFYCAVRTVAIKFAPIGAVPDTLRPMWILSAEPVSYAADCG